MKAILLIIYVNVYLAQLSFAQTATCQVTPQVLPKGQQGSYQIILQGTSSAQGIGGQLPQVSGLKISNNPSTSTQMQFINGRAHHQITYSFPLVGDTIGSHSIPGWEMKWGNRILKIPETTVKIVDAQDVFKGVFDLQLRLNKEEYYVGELIQAELILWVRNGVEARLVDTPEKIGDAFVQESLKENPWKITSVMKEGLRFEMATANLILSAIKPGQQSLRFRLPLKVRQQNQLSRIRDPFFDDFFPGRSSYRELIQESDNISCIINPLPQDGKPDGFSGAIGKFKSAVSFTPKQVSVGEPVTLRFEITGQGNFERILAPKLKNSDDHKIYPPKIEFHSGSSQHDVEDKKIFEYIIIPKHENADRLMNIPFFFFDPEPGIYVDISQEPGEMVVIPHPNRTSNTELNLVQSKLYQNDLQKNERKELLPIKTKAKVWQTTGRTSIWTVEYIGAHITSLALIAGIVLNRRKKLLLESDIQLRKHLKYSKEVKEWKKRADEAYNNTDINDFMKSACKVMQLAVSKDRQSTISVADSLTSDDIEKFLTEKGIEQKNINDIKSMFETADLIKFAGAKVDSIELKKFHTSLDVILKTL